jgi:hypothetical protein
VADAVLFIAVPGPVNKDPAPSGYQEINVPSPPEQANQETTPI